jgi:glycosidase
MCFIFPIRPHFGTRQDLRDMVRTAHDQGIYVVLDIILNHSGNVFAYDPNRYLEHDARGNPYFDARWDNHLYDCKGWNDPQGAPRIPYGAVDLQAFPDAWPDGSIWPADYQRSETFTRKGRINSWDYLPEYLEGDFFA